MSLQQRLTKLEQSKAYQKTEPNYLLVKWVGNPPNDGLDHSDDYEAGFLMVTDSKGSRTYHFNQKEYDEYKKLQNEQDIEVWLNTVPRPPDIGWQRGDK